MGQKLPYTLYKRQTCETTIYYVRLNIGDKRVAKSTGQTSEKEAREYVIRLLSNPIECSKLFASHIVEATESKALQVLPAYSKMFVRFSSYAKKWWLWDECEYVLNKRAAGTDDKPGIKESSVYKSRQWMDSYIVPYFGRMKMGMITTGIVNDFLTYLRNDHGLSPKTINNIRSVLSVMMEEAVNRRIIPFNPVDGTQKRKVDKKKTELLTDEECAKLFDPDRIKELWNDNICFYAINYISGVTGMRVGELLALTFHDISVNEIRVSRNYSSKFGFGATKNSEPRIVPITKEIYILLYTAFHAYEHDSDYIFCVSSDKPVGASNCRRALYRALKGIGISEQERKRRNITFHSWRHKFNTDCVKANMHPAKIRAITGHKSESMLYTYTNLSTADLADQVNEIQNRRMSPLTGKKKEDQED